MAAELSKNALSILEKRYLKRDTSGNLIETPDNLFRRVAKAVAEAEYNYQIKNEIQVGRSISEVCKYWEDKFYEMMSNLDFLPNSPTMFNAGKETGTLSGCFFFNVGDSMVEIMDVATKASLVQKHGGGVGYALSDLRPKGALIKSTHGKACGPIAVMKTYHAVDDMITQGGKRAGAQMAVLNCDHPDIEEFITCKEDDNTLTTFNISVAATDEFMNAVIEGKDEKRVRLFQEIVEHAWKNGDPGLWFIDRVNRDNPTPWLGKLTGTNPCSELPLLDNESCNLGSINLSKFVLNVTDIDTKQVRDIIGWEHLKEVTELAVRFLDDVIDVNKFPVEVIKEATLKTRKIGLGVMGWADMLVKLSIPYNSDEAVKLAEEVMGKINIWALTASEKLGQERGVYPASPVTSLPNIIRVRNATRTTIAPTGSLSLIAGCSSGIEPIYALVYKRSNMSGALEGLELEEAYPLFVEAMRTDIGPVKNLDEKIRSILKRLSKGVKLDEVPELSEGRFKNPFVTALDIPYEWHIKMQAAFQKHVDNAISKTINMPNSATVEDVRNAYIIAWQLGCKGVTVYRDGSREKQVLTSVRKDKGTGKDDVTKGVRPRNRRMLGGTTRKNTGCGWVYITVNRDDLGPREVFITLGKTGGCASAYLEAIGRLVSLALKNNIDVHSIVKQLDRIRCPGISRDGEQKILSCPDAVAKVLLEEIGETDTYKDPNNQSLPEYENPTINTAGVCPECGDILVSEEGCLKCRECGYSRC